MISFLISAIKIIFLLGLLIGIHETGHFLIAKLCKVRVNEFAIGFGPVIWKKQGKETKYELRLIPLGGFVNMEGEAEHSEQEGSFSKASIPKRIAIVAAGAIVNIVFALILYFGLSATSIHNTSNTVAKLTENYPAEQAGLQEGDKILKINNKKIVTIWDIKENINGEDEVAVLIERDGEKQTITIKPIQEEGRYYLGVEMAIPEDTFGNRVYYAIHDTNDFLFSIFDNIKQLFTGNVSTAQLVGPVGISEVVAKTDGVKEFIYILAVISISLGVTNLLPFPPLDGGKILLILIEAIRRKPLKEETELKIQMLGFAVLITVSLMVTYNDILRLKF